MTSCGSLLFCFLLLAGLAGCASTEQSPKPESKPAETSGGQEALQKTVRYSCDADNGFTVGYQFIHSGGAYE